MPLPTLISTTVGGYTGGTGSTVSVTFDSDCTLVVVFALQKKDPSTPTGQSLTIDGSSTGVVAYDNVDSGSGTAMIYAWYKKNPGLSGAKNVVESHTNNALQRLIIYQFKNVDPTTPVGTESEATGSTNAPTVNATILANQMCIDAMIAGTDTRTASVGADQTETANTDGGEIRFCSSYDPFGAGTRAMSWTLSGTATWAIMAIPITGLPGGAQVIMF